jgi:transcriptional regulator with XRE-family HTH domain
VSDSIVSPVRPEFGAGLLAVGDERARLERAIRAVLGASREDADVSQKQLAVKLGWTRNVVANLETGRRVVGLADFVLIARELRIEPERLLLRILRWWLHSPCRAG